MMPTLLSFGSFHLHSFGFMIALGVLVCMLIMKRKAKSHAVFTYPQMLDIVFVEIFSGFIGGRIAYILENYQYYERHPFEIFAVWQGGLIFYGGLIGSVAGLLIYAKAKRINLLEMFDFLGPYTALAHAFGRLGCFLNGCCYGKACDLPWALTFPGASESVHPTQLYEAFYAFMLFLILMKVTEKKQFRGQVMALYFIGYAMGRFTIEFFRADTPMALFFTTNQWFSLLLIAVFSGLYFKLKRRKA